MKDAINKLVEKDDYISLKQLTRKHLISEGFKSLTPVEAFKFINEQKKRWVKCCKEHQNFYWNSAIFQT